MEQNKIVDLNALKTVLLALQNQKETSYNVAKITLFEADWAINNNNLYEQTITLNGISADETEQIITISPYGEDLENFQATSNIYCSKQGNNSLAFLAINEKPDRDIELTISWQLANYFQG